MNLEEIYIPRGKKSALEQIIHHNKKKNKLISRRRQIFATLIADEGKNE